MGRVLDRAGWHWNQELKIPDNMRLLSLLPYSSELNPVEHLWNELREKFFHNRIFDSLEVLEDHLKTGLRSYGIVPRYSPVHCVMALDC